MKTKLSIDLDNTNKLSSRSNTSLIPQPDLRCAKKQSGFSLIEVMISAFVLSLSLLGVLSLQLVSMKGTQQSYMKQQAMGVVNSFVERMRANRDGVIARNYLVDSVTFDCTTALPNCETANCSAQQIAETDKLNLICGSQSGGGNFTSGVKISNASDNAVLTGGTLKVICAPEDIPGGILADCASADISISVGWTERAFGNEEATVSDSLELQTRIGL